jgi:hypothetical protein
MIILCTTQNIWLSNIKTLNLGEVGGRTLRHYQLLSLSSQQPSYNNYNAEISHSPMYDIITHPTVKKLTKLCYNTVTHVNNWKTSPQN